MRGRNTPNRKERFKEILSDFIDCKKGLISKLRYNFVMHLTTVQIYGLINANDLLQLLLEFDEKAGVVTI